MHSDSFPTNAKPKEWGDKVSYVSTGISFHLGECLAKEGRNAHVYVNDDDDVLHPGLRPVCVT